MEHDQPTSMPFCYYASRSPPKRYRRVLVGRRRMDSRLWQVVEREKEAKMLCYTSGSAPSPIRTHLRSDQRRAYGESFLWGLHMNIHKMVSKEGPFAWLRKESKSLDRVWVALSRLYSRPCFYWICRWVNGSGPWWVLPLLNEEYEVDWESSKPRVLLSYLFRTNATSVGNPVPNRYHHRSKLSESVRTKCPVQFSSYKTTSSK